MEITSIGNNTITACPNCDEVLSVKGTGGDGMDAIGDLFDRHLSERAECRKHQDELPSFEDVVTAWDKQHDTHDCNPGPCPCICGCGQMVNCTVAFGPLCGTCYVRDQREDDEHGEPDALSTAV